MRKEKILVVEDDAAILTGLVDLLRGEGYETAQAADGKEALRLFAASRPSLVLLDIMIPEKSGYDVCREIRSKDARTPILMLTAKGREADKVVGLELGADDYLVKPFGVAELLARVRALLRRGRTATRPQDFSPIVFGDVRVDPKTYEGRRGNEHFTLTGLELKLLRHLVDNDGQVMERFDLLEAVWGMKYEGTTRTLDQHIARLRRKVESDPSSPRHILTVHGVGYRFRSKP
ncbi:MAG: DNA-binding response regulator [Candidatus Aminicenantes bacterium RBG_13_62_12]|nr:MAG: DNA-binding response regulator [Candidatus Aminicenantes bacterium RBG_13_62_12]